MNQLAVVRTERLAEPHSRGSSTVAQGRTHRTGRIHGDFVVDGMALSREIQKKADLISVLGWGVKSEQQQAVDRLLLLAPADFPGNRYALYVCPECGDLSCGAVTAVIQRRGDIVVWRDWGYQNNYDGEPPSRDHLESLAEYQFPWSEYEKNIRSAFGIGGFDQLPGQAGHRG